MASIKYSSENNSLQVISGHNSHYSNYSEYDIEGWDNVEVLGNNKKSVGANIKNFLSETEQKGFNAEMLFHAFLEENNIPSLHVGQGPEGITYSDPLKKSQNANRPDFLVNFPDIGCLFFDVKCRKKTGFKSGESEYYYLYKAEATNLLNLHESLLIPVWIAFYDEADLDTGEKKFNLMPISLFKKIQESLKSSLTQEEFDLIKVFRIPSEFLIQNEGRFNFDFGISDVQQEVLSDLSIRYKALTRVICDHIKQAIRSEPVFKTHIAKLVMDSVDWCFRSEVDDCLRHLIDDGTIIYKQRECLKLSGEY